MFAQILSLLHLTAVAPALPAPGTITNGTPAPPSNLKQAWADAKAFGDDVALIAAGQDPTGADFADAAARLEAVMADVGHPAPASIVDAIQGIAKAEAFLAPYEPFLLATFKAGLSKI